jgi:predicted DNA binding CopG/RHH family protein
MKKVTIASKPQSSANRKAADEWVKASQAAAEPNKRLTVDVPLTLHTRIKTQCAMQGDKMADVIRDLLEKHFAEGPPSGAGSHAPP